MESARVSHRRRGEQRAQFQRAVRQSPFTCANTRGKTALSFARITAPLRGPQAKPSEALPSRRLRLKLRPHAALSDRRFHRELSSCSLSLRFRERRRRLAGLDRSPALPRRVRNRLSASGAHLALAGNRYGCCNGRDRCVGTTAATFHRPLQSLNRRVETIPLCNQQSNYLFGLHHRIVAFDGVSLNGDQAEAAFLTTASASAAAD